MSLAFTADGRLRRPLRPAAVPVGYACAVVTAGLVLRRRPDPVERAVRRADRAVRLAERGR